MQVDNGVDTPNISDEPAFAQGHPPADPVHEKRSKDFEVVTCWIAAERALQHVRGKISQVAELFRKWRIRESEYGVYAGFDESLIQAGLGYLEQIHVFVSAEFVASPLLLSELGAIFSPFSAILFTESSSYHIPVFKNDGSIWEFDQLVYITASKFVDQGSSASMPPIVVSLSQTPGKPRSFSQGSFGTREGEQNEMCGAKKDEDDGAEKDDDGGDGPEEPLGGGGEITGPIKVSYNIASRIHSNQNEPDEKSNIFQSVTTEGALTIQTTPLNPQMPDEFPECRIQFSKLTFGSHRTTGSAAYGQFHVRVVIDPRQENADVTVIKPQQSRAFDRETKESSGEKIRRILAGNLGATFGFRPQASLPAAGTQTSGVSGSCVKKRYNSRITQKSMLGVVWWGFAIDDPYEQQESLELSDAILPTVDFEFIGDSDVPAPAPSHIDIEIASYWSMVAGSTREGNWIRRLLSKASKTGCYSNLCQLVALGIPSNLAKHSDYQATLHVNPGDSDAGQKTDPVAVASEISLGKRAASVKQLF